MLFRSRNVFWSEPFSSSLAQHVMLQLLSVVCCASPCACRCTLHELNLLQSMLRLLALKQASNRSSAGKICIAMKALTLLLHVTAKGSASGGSMLRQTNKMSSLASGIVVLLSTQSLPEKGNKDKQGKTVSLSVTDESGTVSSQTSRAVSSQHSPVVREPNTGPV